MSALFHYMISGFTEKRGEDYMMMDMTGSGHLDPILYFSLAYKSVSRNPGWMLRCCFMVISLCNKADLHT